MKSILLACAFLIGAQAFSQKVDEKVESVKKNSKILIKIIDLWLLNHTISETELELLRETIKQL
jgi:hypothetical protein